MVHRRAKSAPKIFESDRKKIQEMVLKVTASVSEIVGSSLGPSGRLSVLESDLPNIPNTITKDGVSIFKSLGHNGSQEQLLIEVMRDVATRTVSEAGDGPQPLYAKVLTPKGFVEMGDVKVGMEVCGTNGTIQKVIGVYPKGQKKIYEVYFGNRVVECCEDHLWQVTTNYGTQEVKPVSSLIKDFKKTKGGNTSYKYYTPIAEVEFHENKTEMPLDPYLVGVLLGDGSLSGSGSIELSMGKPKEHILKKIVLPQGLYLQGGWVEEKNAYRIKIQGETSKGQNIYDIVRSIGLLGTKSETKFIPKSYLYASKQTRKALLQGLLDTDGFINNRGLFEFSTISNELNADFQFLTRSLGYSLYPHKLERKEGDGSYSKKPTNRVFQLKGYKFGDKITEIRPTGRFTEMQCIKVSNPDSLYITDNFVVTHNTTTATVLAHNIIKNLFEFCNNNPKYSPQKAVRRITKVKDDLLLPYIKNRAIKVDDSNQDLLRMVAKISGNGDDDLANAVIEAFEAVGYGESSHVTIRQMSGKNGYKVERIDGFPIPIGYEESAGRLHPHFINDQANLRTFLTDPLFVLFDGQLTDLIALDPLFAALAERFTTTMDSKYKNLVLVANGYSEAVITQLAVNFQEPNTLNVFPLVAPMAQFLNSQNQFLRDLSAFTGAKIFGMKDQIANVTIDDLGAGMESFECTRFRSTVVGDPDPVNIEVRAEELKTMKQTAESQAETMWLEERIGKITNGIAKLTVYAGSGGELKELHDRVEDAVCAVRATISAGALPGGCRVALDMVQLLSEELPEGDPAREVLIPSLLALPMKLLDNAGYSEDEILEILGKLAADPDTVYDVENQVFGKALDLGLFDATKAVSESLSNAVSIAGVLGTMGGIVCHPRDGEFERAEAMQDNEFIRNTEHAGSLRNEANYRS